MQAHAGLLLFTEARTHGRWLPHEVKPMLLHGLDCGPMSGFDAAAVDRKFWGDTQVRSNFLCKPGQGEPAPLKSPAPRIAFDEVCTVP